MCTVYKLIEKISKKQKRFSGYSEGAAENDKKMTGCVIEMPVIL